MFTEGQAAYVAVAIVYHDRLPERRLLRRDEVEDAEHGKQYNGNGGTDSGRDEHEVTQLSRGASDGGKTALIIPMKRQQLLSQAL